MAEIIITSDRTGEAKIATSGFKGKACLKATEGIKDLIGGEQTDLEMTTESRTEVEQEQSQQLHGQTGR